MAHAATVTAAFDPTQTVASLRSRRTESRNIADDVVSTTRTLSGLPTCVVAFKPICQLLVSGDAIALEAFLQAPQQRRRHRFGAINAGGFLSGACRQKTGFIGTRGHADCPLHCGQADAPWRSLSVIIGDAARAFRRLAPMTFAEASAHALVAQYASDQVTAAARQAYMHRLPRIWPPCFAGFRNTDGCCGTGLCYRWGRAHRCRHLRHRALMHVCALRGGNRHRALMHVCALRGGTRQRALTRACALRCLGGGSGNGRLEGGSWLGFHRLRLHRHKHSRRRCGCVVLTGIDRLRGDSHRVGRRRTDAVRGIGTRDQDRRDGSQAPARGRHLGGERRLRHGCRDAHVAWCCPRRRSNVSGWQHWHCLGCGE